VDESPPPPGPGTTAAPPGPPGRPAGAGTVGAVLRAAAELYRRRAGPLVLVATIFLVPNAVLGVLERRAEESVPPAATAPEGLPEGTGAARAPAPARPAEVGPAEAAPPGPPSEDVLTGLTAREVTVRGVWLFIGSLFTSMLAAAVSREAALAVVGRAPAPLRSAGYGFARVLGLGLLAILAAAWAFFLFLFMAPAFVVLSLLQRSIPAGITSAAAALLAFPVAVVFATLASIGIPVFVVEGRRGMGALVRVWLLVRGEIKHVAATVVILLFVGLAASGLAFAVATSGSSGVAAALAFGIVGAPFEGLIAFFLYLDLRARKERVTVATLEGELARHAP